MKRFGVYGDIVQNARGGGELEELLRRCDNSVPSVINFLEVREKLFTGNHREPLKSGSHVASALLPVCVTFTPATQPLKQTAHAAAELNRKCHPHNLGSTI